MISLVKGIIRITSGCIQRHDGVFWRNGCILGDAWWNVCSSEDVWRNVSKNFNVPIIFNKIFIIIGIGSSRRKGEAAKLIMIGLGLHVLMMT